MKTSGASAPEFLVDEIVAKLKSLGAREVEDLVSIEEDVHFPLPAELARTRAERGRPALPSIPA